jgi:hypothetical protein
LRARPAPLRECARAGIQTRPCSDSNLTTGTPTRALRAGDLVTVRSASEILATLDAGAKLDRLPFMPEMLRFCGQAFRVAAVAHKTCDPAHKTGGRRMDAAVHLEGLRCDGSSHGGCQAACLLFWKTAWLRPAVQLAPAPQPPADPTPILLSATATGAGPGAPTIYSCQATCLFDATRPLKWWQVDQYLRDLASGNVGFAHWARVLVLAWLRALMRVGIGYRLTSRLYRLLHRRLLDREPPAGCGGPIAVGAPTPAAALDLQPGEWVRVKPDDAIRATLNAQSKNRGMWYDDEAAVFCGQSHQVEARVERIINEVTGEMMEMKTPCITLKDVTCRSLYSRDRLFCPRAITPYWREIWLERTAPPARGAGGSN